MTCALRPARGWQRLQVQDWRRLRSPVDEFPPFLLVRNYRCLGTRWRRSRSAGPRAGGGGAGAGGGVGRARAKEGLGLVILGLDAVASVVLLEVEQAACMKGS